MAGLSIGVTVTVKKRRGLGIVVGAGVVVGAVVVVGIVAVVGAQVQPLQNAFIILVG